MIRVNDQNQTQELPGTVPGVMGMNSTSGNAQQFVEPLLLSPNGGNVINQKVGMEDLNNSIEAMKEAMMKQQAQQVIRTKTPSTKNAACSITATESGDNTVPERVERFTVRIS